MKTLDATLVVDGHEAVIELAERLLVEAKKKRTRYMAVVRCEHPLHADMEYAGAGGCEFAANWAFDILKKSLHRPIVSNIADLDALALGRDYICYDLTRAPMSFDFAAWLVHQTMLMTEAGLPGPLKIAFKEPAKDRLITPYNEMFFNNVMLPLVEMIGARVDQRAIASRNRSEFYCNRPIAEASAVGKAVPKFKPKESATLLAKSLVNGRQPVTITLREATHDPVRNSDMRSWLRFAEDLQRAGERVIFLRDTEKVDEPLHGYETCPIASRDLQVRLALYEQSKCNYFVSNGPVALAMFSDAPYIFMNEISDHPGSCNSTGTWLHFHGTDPGTQFSWARPDQRIFWAGDNYESIKASWNEFVSVNNTGPTID